MLRTVYHRASRALSRSRSPSPSRAVAIPSETTLVSDELARLERSRSVSDEVGVYLSVRVTVKHSDVQRLLDTVFSTTDYICYKHRGVRTHKEHVHVLVPDIEKHQSLRCKLSRAGYKGNGEFSIKKFDNGLSKGIQYASKEGTEPIYSGDFEEIIANAPKWVQKDMYTYTERPGAEYKKMRDWQLTYTNVVPVVVRYVQDTGNTHLSFFDAIDFVMDKTNWRLCDKILHCGIGPFHISDYEKRIGRGTKFDTTWKTSWRQ